MPQKLWMLATLLASVGCAGEDLTSPAKANFASAPLKLGPALSPAEAKSVAVKTIAPRTRIPGGLLPGMPPMGNIGFASQSSLKEQYRKHMREFGGISMNEYLRRAQSLRDRPLEPTTLQGVQPNGDTVRFDRTRKAMLIYRRDRVIRSFSKPRLGERTFYEQIR